MSKKFGLFELRNRPLTPFWMYSERGVALGCGTRFGLLVMTIGLRRLLQIIHSWQLQMALSFVSYTLSFAPLPLCWSQKGEVDWLEDSGSKCLSRRAAGSHGSASLAPQRQQVHPTLTGSAHIYSDCLGALSRVETIPPGRIPSRCRYSDILKNIMVNCSALTFRHFSHVKAHQDDHLNWDQLSRPAQMNCACDIGGLRMRFDLRI